MAGKTLILCYSLTGKTLTACKNLARFAPARLQLLRPVSGQTKLYAYTLGLHKAKRGIGVDLLPVEDDVSDYQRLVLAGPVWGGCPAPALYGFLRAYALKGKEIHGLLTYGKNVGKAPDILQEEIMAAGAFCRSMVTLKSDGAAIRRLAERKVELYLDLENGISLRKP